MSDDVKERTPREKAIEYLTGVLTDSQIIDENVRIVAAQLILNHCPEPEDEECPNSGTQ